MTIPVGSEAAFAIAGHCDPRYRKKGVHRLVHRELLRIAKERGRRRVRWFLHAKDRNRALASYERAGFRQQEVAKVQYVRIFGWRKLFVRPL